MQRPEIYAATPQEIAERLRLVREQLGFQRQADFASRLKRSRNSISAYERAKAVPDGETLLRLAALGINIQWLLTGRGTMLHKATLPPAPMDRVFMGRIVDTIHAVYAAQDQLLSCRFLGEMAADWYEDIVNSTDRADERLELLAQRQIALSRQLRTQAVSDSLDNAPV